MNSRAKGARGEREFRDFLIERGHQARRGQQFCGGPDSPDVVWDLDDLCHLEVKRTEALRLYAALDQAIADSGTRLPVVVHRQSQREWIAILRAEDFLRLLELAAPAMRVAVKEDNHGG